MNDIFQTFQAVYLVQYEQVQYDRKYSILYSMTGNPSLKMTVSERFMTVSERFMTVSERFMTVSERFMTVSKR
jgi:hypothetical protein